MDGHVHLAEAFLAIAVHVFGGGIAGLLCGLDEGVEQGIVLVGGMDPERAVVAVIGVAALLAMLGAPEVGQDLLVRPAFAIFLEGPAVVVERMAADIDHGVERRRAAQHAPARPIHDALVHVGLRLGVVVPVVPVVHQVVHERGRHVDFPVPPRIARPGFQQAHLVGRILTEAIGEHAPGGPAADDQVVIDAVEFHRCTLIRTLVRHGRTWSDHPRVSLSKARRQQANSWMVVPSTTMTEWGAAALRSWSSFSTAPPRCRLRHRPTSAACSARSRPGCSRGRCRIACCRRTASRSA